MNKKTLLASAAILFLASCSDEIVPTTNGDLQIEGESRIFATYQGATEYGGSRTYLEPNGSKFDYKWSQGDAIGVYGTNVNNAMYVNVKPDGAPSEFVGPAKLNINQTYYGYYPFDGDQVWDATEHTVNMAIASLQNFNYTASLSDSEIPTAAGSFAQGEAPAVAVGVPSSTKEMNFSLTPLASYMYVPIQGVGNITSLKLTIENSNVSEQNGSESFYFLNGYASIDIDDTQDYEAPGQSSTEGLVVSNLKALTTTEDNPNYSQTAITLLCGDGVELQLNQPTNFWFVIPVGIELQNSTISVYVNEEDEPSITKTFTGSYLTKRSGVFAMDKNPYVFTGGKYLIQNQQQFIEYCNLVSTTNIETLLQNWAALQTSLNGMTEANQELYGTYTDLMNMVEGYNAVTQSITGVKDAVILANTLDFGTEFQKTMSNVFAPAASSSPLYPSEGLLPYFKQVYEEFYNFESGEMSSIGGGYEFNLSGNTNTTISNLTINGNGIFGGVTTNVTATIGNITFTGVNVKPQTVVKPTLPGGPYGYYLLNQKYTNNNTLVVTYSNVIIGTDCEVTAPENAVEPIMTAAFDQVATAFLPVSGVDFGEGVTMKLANAVRVNNGYNFATGTAVENFNKIVLIKGANEKAITVKDDKAAEYLINNASISSDVTGYSVVDLENVSYWTGTAYQTNDYAEGLAYAVQNAGESVTLGNYDLDLMSENWWNAYEEAGALTVNLTEDVTISGVSINGLNKDKEEITYLTLLGNKVSVTGENTLTISDINVNLAEDYEAAEGAVIAAIGNTPGEIEEDAATIVVNKMNITANAETFTTVGGLYATLSQENVENVSKGSKVVNETAAGLTYGYLAGTMSYEIAATAATATINGYDFASGAFGKVTVNVNGKDAAVSEIFVTVDDIFNIPSLLNGELPNGLKIGDSTIGDLNLTCSNITDKIQINIPAGKKDWYYFFTATEKGITLTGYGYISTAEMTAKLSMNKF